MSEEKVGVGGRVGGGGVSEGGLIVDMGERKLLSKNWLLAGRRRRRRRVYVENASLPSLVKVENLANCFQGHCDPMRYTQGLDRWLGTGNAGCKSLLRDTSHNSYRVDDTTVPVDHRQPGNMVHCCYICDTESFVTCSLFRRTRHPGVDTPGCQTRTSNPSVVNSNDLTTTCINRFTNYSKQVNRDSPCRQRANTRDALGKSRFTVGGGGGGGGSGSQLGIVVTVLALMLSSCQALPTQSTQQQANLYTAYTSQFPPKKDWRLCCSGSNGKLTSVQAGNVTVLRTSPTSVFVTWSRHAHQRVKYEVTYKPINAKYRVVAEVMAPQRSIVLERLLPLTQYQLQVTTVINNTLLWSSPVVTFHTTRDDSIPGNETGRLISTPTVLDAVDVSLGDLDPTNPIQQEGFVRVRAEEVGIVLLVLAVWMFAIALFFNRWGKIRMLEPYQEPYKEAPPQLLQHRPSCPMADPCSLPINPLKFEHNGSHRPRQNSVFVGRTRSHSLEVHPPRRVKSALNLTTLVLQESEEESGMATTFT